MVPNCLRAQIFIVISNKLVQTFPFLFSMLDTKLEENFNLLVKHPAIIDDFQYRPQSKDTQGTTAIEKLL